MSQLLDYAWGRPHTSKLKAAGYAGVLRYLSHDTTGKNLTRTEANELSAAGLYIGVVWEGRANRALDGATAGRNDATDAHAMAVQCGMPSDRPIYFAVDFDVSASEMNAVMRYLHAAQDVLGASNVGVYGGKRCVTTAMDDGIEWGWQTYAWSGGKWDSRAQIQQYSNSHTFDGVDCDYDRTMDTDAGLWRVGENPMALTDADKKWISAEISRVVWTADTCPAPDDTDPNTTWMHENVMRITYLRARDSLAATAALTEKVDKLITLIEGTSK